MTVSSKHMCLASPVFKAMLQSGGFKEGFQQNAAGQLEVELPEDDFVVMAIALNIIHGRTRLLPKDMNLEMLTQLAVLADKYQRVEAVESHSHTWIDRLTEQAGIPTGYDMAPMRIVRQWLAVSAKHLDELGDHLPIPDVVIKKIADTRQYIMEHLLRDIEIPLANYQSVTGRPSCSVRGGGFDCDAMILGSLIRALIDVNLWPLPEHPYGPLTYRQLVSKIKNLEVVSLCDKLRAGPRAPQSGHGLLEDLLDGIAYVEQNCYKGLEMKGFKD